MQDRHLLPSMVGRPGRYDCEDSSDHGEARMQGYPFDISIGQADRYALALNMYDVSLCDT